MSGSSPNPQAIKRAFAATVRLLRKRAGITQEKLALECSLNRTHVWEIEQARHVPTLETIHKLLPGLNSSIIGFVLEYETLLRQEMRRKNNAPPKP